MAGTTAGGKQASKTNKERYGKNFYAKIGAIGGKKTGNKGFALNRELASEAGRKGGKISSRRGIKNKSKLSKSDVYSLSAIG